MRFKYPSEKFPLVIYLDANSKYLVRCVVYPYFIWNPSIKNIANCDFGFGNLRHDHQIRNGSSHHLKILFMLHNWGISRCHKYVENDTFLHLLGDFGKQNYDI